MIDRKVIPVVIILFIALLLIHSCDDSSTNSNDIVFPSKNVSYSQHVQPLFNIRCVNSGCHDDQSRAGNLTLTSYLGISVNPGVVIPGNSQSSKLAQKIDGRLPHQNIAPILITTNQINGIIIWIDEGAKNN
jgi:hypothetical protein